MGFVLTSNLSLSRVGIALATLLVVLLAPAKSHAQTFTWNQTGGSSWQTVGNWTPGGGPPNGASTVAVFGNSLTANSSITLTSGVTVGELRFEDVNAGTIGAAYTIAAGQSITFNNGAAPSQINVAGFTVTNQTIAAGIIIGGSQPLNITNNGAPGLTTLTISGGISATTGGTALNIDGAANTTISGVIGTAAAGTNVGTLTKSGSGILTLSGANLYSGGTVINGGTVRITANNQLGAAAGTVTLNGGTLHFAASIGTGRNFTLGAGGGTILTTAGNGVTSNPTITGVISGTGPLTLDGGLYVELRGSNTYTGATIVNNAGVMLNNGGQLSGTSSVTINGFVGGQIGILDLQNGGAPNNDRLNDAAPIILNGGLLSYIPGTFTSTNETLGNLTVKGFGSLFANQAPSGATGTLTFGALSRFDNFSTLYVGGAVHGPGAESNTITFTSGLSQSPGSGTQIPVVPWIGGDLGLNDGSTIHGTGFAETLYTYNDTLGLLALTSANYVQVNTGIAMTANRNISLVGNPAAVNSPLSILALIVSPSAPGSGVTVTGSSTLTIASGAIAHTLPLTFDGPTLNFGANTGYLWLGDVFTVQGNSQITGSGGLVVSSSAPDPFNALRLINTANPNAFTGGLYLNGTGTVEFDTSDAQLGAPGEVISFRGGALHYSGGSSITLATSGSNRPLVMSAAGGGVVNVELLGVTLTVPGLVSGAEQLTKIGGGTLVLSNTANTYAGGTTIVEGTLAIAGPGSLGSGNVILGRAGFVGASLRFDFSGTMSANIAQAASASLNTNGNNVTLSGVISGAVTGTLTKSGAGTLTLSAANTYTANTAVTGGTLLVTNTTGSGTGYGTVAVNGAILGGTGTVGGSVAVNATGKLVAGTPGGTGTLTLRGRANTLVSGSVFQTHVAGTTAGSGYAQLVITSGGAIALGSSILDATLGYTPTGSDKVFLIDNRNATGGLTGTFATLAQGATYTFANGTTAVISYTGDFGTGALTGGNDVVLHSFVPVPEPATVLGIAALALGGLMWRSRRGAATLVA